MGPGVLLACSVVSAALTTLAFPAFDLGFLAWFSLAPLLFALRRTRPLAGAGLGLLFGCCLASGVFYWLGLIEPMTVRTTLVMYLGFALYYSLFGLLYSLLSRLPGIWVLFGAPALWVALEYARANLSFLALPWNLLGHSQYQYLPLIQIADATGVYGLSFLLVMINEFASRTPDLFVTRLERRGEGRTTWTREASVRALALASVLTVTLAYGWYALAAPEGGERLRVALVQANILRREKMTGREQIQHLRVYEQLTREVAARVPDLIVWPSSSLPAPIGFPAIRHSLARLARETSTYLLVGGAGGDKFAPRQEGYLAYSNSEFLISPSGRLEGQYNKIRLTPFDEYVPLRGIVPWPGWMTTMKDSFVPGTEYTLFQIRGGVFGSPICWENTFPDLFRRFVRDGAQFMVSVTNEGFFGYTAAPHQTLAMNVFRAVENRVAIARAATTGVSAFISPKGEVVERVTDGQGRDRFVSGVLVRDVPLSDTKTLYTLYGDVFAHAMIAVAGGFVLTALIACRKRADTTSRWSPRLPVVH